MPRDFALLTCVNGTATVDIWQRLMDRPKHPKKEIEQAVRYAEEHGWRYISAGGSAHCWGRLYCPERSRDGCMMSIWSTPRSPANHAEQILRAVKKCPHGGVS